MSSFFRKLLSYLIQTSLENPWMILGACAFVFISALFSFHNLPIDAVPDITPVQVVINTKTKGLDPEKIEAFVTKMIETEMTGLPHLDEMRSISKFGLSQVTLVFEDGTDIYWARAQVSQRLDVSKASLPEAITPELAPITTGLGEVIFYSVEAKKGSALDALSEQKRLTELRTIQDYFIRPKLKRIRGVADIDTNGGYKKEIHINFFPEKLEKVGLSLDQLVARLKTIGENFGGGYIQQNGSQVIVRTSPKLSTLADFDSFPLGRSINGSPILLRQVAEVREDYAQRLGSATRMGKEIVLGTVLMQSGSNSREVALAVEERIKSLILPTGIEIVPLYSRSFLVNATLKTVFTSLVEGALIVIFVLLFLLGNIRASLCVALVIPLCMAATLNAMEVFHVSASLMSLGALDFGLIVDGSIVLIENILKRSVTEKIGSFDQNRRKKFIHEASLEVIPSLVFGIFLILLVYVPILFLTGIEGKMFRPMALTVFFALIFSVFVTVMVIPVACEKFILRKTETHQDTLIFEKIRNAYASLQDFSFRKSTLLFSLLAFISGLSFFAAKRLGSDFIPKLNEGDAVLCVSREAKEGIDSSIAHQKQVEDILKAYPEVESVFSRTGTPESATDPMGVNLSDTFLIFKKELSLSAAQKQTIVESMTQKLTHLSFEQEVGSTQPIEMRLNELLEGSRADVTLRFYGNDLTELLNLTTRAKTILEKMSGLESVVTDPLTALRQSPVLDIEPKMDVISRSGLTLLGVNESVEAAMSGKSVGSFFQNNISLPVVVHLDESLRDDLKAIRTIPVSLPEGGTLPLSTLANFSINERITTIARSWGERYAALSLNLKTEDMLGFVNAAQKKIEKEIQLKDGFSLYWGGQYKNLSHAKSRLFFLIPITLLIVFVLLWKSRKSFFDASLLFLCVPFSTIGGIFFLFLFQIPFSISAAVGFIALIGISLLNGLILLNGFPSSAVAADFQNTIKGVSLSRLKPVLMTALVAGLGFLPMAINKGLGAEVQRPVAVVVIGGLISSTLLTLVILPLLYGKLAPRFKAENQ